MYLRKKRLKIALILPVWDIQENRKLTNREITKNNRKEKKIKGNLRELKLFIKILNINLVLI